MGLRNRQTRHTLLMALTALYPAVLVGTGCASVPKEAVTLSSAVGDRIADHQAAHEALVQSYFRATRAHIDQFLTDRWLPEFLHNFVEDLGLGSATVIEFPNADSLKQTIADFFDAALAEYNRQRASVMSPIEQQETFVLRELRASYRDLLIHQKTVTDHLRSVHAVQAEQDALLERLGLRKARDQAVEQALRLNDRVVGLIAAGEEAGATIERLKELISPEDAERN